MDRLDPDKLRSEYNSATTELKKQQVSTKGGKKAETRFASTYQALVRAGLASQIRYKYRVSK